MINVFKDQSIIEKMRTLAAHGKIEEAYDLMYVLIETHESDFISVDDEDPEKPKTIDKLIAYYTKKEDYEKCAYLTNIKNKINK
jgi:hypothetical protein